MADICNVCGLPLDLCVCKEISKQQQRISVKIEKRKYGKPVTVIDGIMDRSLDLRSIAKTLKANCACGGSTKENRILLQGDHRQQAKGYLMELGFPETNIDVK